MDRTFVSRQGRWNSPKFLIGESYGTTRVAGLARRLQSAHRMFLNGVILVSPTGLGIDAPGPGRARATLPYYAATAWYHGALPARPAVAGPGGDPPRGRAVHGRRVHPRARARRVPRRDDRREIARRVAYYSGLSERVVLQHNLAIPTSAFWKELLRERGSPSAGSTRATAGSTARTAGDPHGLRPRALLVEPRLHAGDQPLPARRARLRDRPAYYWIGGPVHPWDRSGDRTGENLRQAMAENPFLHVMIQAGYYDGGTDYFSAKYTMWNLDPAGSCGTASASRPTAAAT